MENKKGFSFTYSASQQQEVEAIREKYLPHPETAVQELLRLHRTVRTAGIAEALAVGVGGFLLFGIGFCLILQVIGSSIPLGIALCLLGAAGMLGAYPAYRTVSRRIQAQCTPRILELLQKIERGALR